MKFLALIIVLLVLGFLLEKIINKLLGISKKKKISETPGKNIDRWVRCIFLVIYLCTLPFTIDKEPNTIKGHYMLFLIALMVFQTFLEWKYLKNSKQYISTLIFLMLAVIFLYNIEYFLKLLE